MKRIIILLALITLLSCEETIYEPQEKITRIELNTWNMDEIGSKWINYINPNIESIDCFITSDNPSIKELKLNSWDSSVNDFKGTIQVKDNQIIITRSENGVFDNELYSSQNINRGYLIIKYY
jgi:hypothetical protein